MRTGNRKPRLNKKPSKGMRQQLKQRTNAIKSKLRKLSHDFRTREQKWFTPRAIRAQWLHSFNTSKYKPHQGEQEKARRVRQMANRTHGY